MVQEPATGITAIIVMIISIMVIAAGYTSAQKKMTVDTETIVMNDAASLYSLLLEISSTEQGYAVYTKITKNYMISLTDSALVVKATTPKGTVIYRFEHNLENIAPKTIDKVEAVCIVKKILNCRPLITLCEPEDKDCCNVGETVC